MHFTVSTALPVASELLGNMLLQLTEHIPCRLRYIGLSNNICVNDQQGKICQGRQKHTKPKSFSSVVKRSQAHQGKQEDCSQVHVQHLSYAACRSCVCIYFCKTRLAFLLQDLFAIVSADLKVAAYTSTGYLFPSQLQLSVFSINIPN